MTSIIFFAWGLAASTVIVHAIGLAWLLRALARLETLHLQHLWAISWRLVWVATYLIVLHMMEISIWGMFYLWQECLPDIETALYFSGVTYATIGYGDVALAKPWRLFGPIEGLIGILMCGLSTGFFFAVVNHIYQMVHTKADNDHKS
ncbi:two pore domain potassium channel family protein [Pseudomonas sp. TH41]|uniref:potassium channel family protein n=1 Tax=Pseudomonas sp. TH41 TaxID=2796405 RepID=UPI00191437BD|nr:potassium channel family protein [Pseudomonas sp. TH41]MBK5356095.1 two pore domain potassium channel family protein [Pseudomonas sp. TH41]